MSGLGFWDSDQRVCWGGKEPRLEALEGLVMTGEEGDIPKLVIKHQKT